MSEGDDGGGGKSDQERFDEQIGREMWTGTVVLAGLGIFAALVISIIALVDSTGGNTTTTVIAPATTSARPASPRLTADALGKQLFISGDPAAGVTGCGSCHTMKAAGTTGTTGPNLDKVLTADPASATLESTVNPNKEIVPGYKANVMPQNYGSRLTKKQLNAVVNYVYRSTNIKAKHASSSSPPAP